MNDTTKLLNGANIQNGNPNSNEVEEAAKQAEESTKQAEEAELEAEYIDVRTVVVSPIKNYSAYRKINMAALEAPVALIGSSVNSCRRLLANKEEIKAYFPQLGVTGGTDAEFISNAKQYLNNIRVVVPDEGIKLNCSFIFKHKRDYVEFTKEENRILSTYDKVNRNNMTELSKAANRRDDELNRLYSTLYRYGNPENISDFIIWRHCMLYSEVAKDTAFINSNQNLRFYIKDVVKEKEREKKRVEERKSAMRNAIELFASPTKTNAVYIAIANYKALNVSVALEKETSEVEKFIMDFATENPSKFNKIYKDKNLESKAFIETLISRGELVRAEFNQQISTPDGTFIGANLNEAVAFFENPDNAAMKMRLESKLKVLNI